MITARTTTRIKYSDEEPDVPAGTYVNVAEVGDMLVAQTLDKKINFYIDPDEFDEVSLNGADPEFFSAIDRYAKNMAGHLAQFGVEITPDYLEEMVREEVLNAARLQLRNLFLELLNK